MRITIHAGTKGAAHLLHPMPSYATTAASLLLLFLLAQLGVLFGPAPAHALQGLDLIRWRLGNGYLLGFHPRRSC